MQSSSSDWVPQREMEKLGKSPRKIWSLVKIIACEVVFHAFGKMYGTVRRPALGKLSEGRRGLLAKLWQPSHKSKIIPK